MADIGRTSPVEAWSKHDTIFIAGNKENIAFTYEKDKLIL